MTPYPPVGRPLARVSPAWRPGRPTLTSVPIPPPRTLDEFLLARADDDPNHRRAEFTREAVADHPLIEGPSRFELSCGTCPEEEWPCQALREAAGPYTDHPDYRVEWAPDEWHWSV